MSQENDSTTLDDMTMGLLGDAPSETPAPAQTVPVAELAPAAAAEVAQLPEAPAAVAEAPPIDSAPAAGDVERKTAALLFGAMKGFEFKGPTPSGIKLLESADDRPAYEALRMLRLAGFAMAEVEKLLGELERLDALPARAAAEIERALMGDGGLVERLTKVTSAFGPALSKVLRDSLTDTLREFNEKLAELTDGKKNALDEHALTKIREVESTLIAQMISRLGETLSGMTNAKIGIEGDRKDLAVERAEFERERDARSRWYAPWPLVTMFLFGACSAGAFLHLTH